MGLLDSLPPGGAPSRLLDLLRTSALNQNLNMGIGADVAGYDQPAMPLASSATTRLAPSLGAFVVPAQGLPGLQSAPAAGSQAPASLSSWSDVSHRLLAGLNGFTGNISRGPIGAVAGGLGALMTGQSPDLAGKSIADLIKIHRAVVRNNGAATPSSSQRGQS